MARIDRVRHRPMRDIDVDPRRPTTDDARDDDVHSIIRTCGTKMPFDAYRLYLVNRARMSTTRSVRRDRPMCGDRTVRTTHAGVQYTYSMDSNPYIQQTPYSWTSISPPHAKRRRASSGVVGRRHTRARRCGIFVCARRTCGFAATTRIASRESYSGGIFARGTTTVCH